MITKEQMDMALKYHIPVRLSYIECDFSHEDIWVNGFGCNAIIPKKELKLQKNKSALDLFDEPFYTYVIGKDSNTYILSQKAYLYDSKEKPEKDISKFSSQILNNKGKGDLEIGKVYPATVLSSCKWGTFCQVNGCFTVLVHCKEWSVCRFSDIRNVAKPGMQIEVKLLSRKTTKDGQVFYSASRKDAYESKDHVPGDVVPVILNTLVEQGDGFYCEVDPDKSGIIDLYNNKFYSEGQTIWGYIKKVSSKGYQLKPYEHRK